MRLISKTWIFLGIKILFDILVIQLSFIIAYLITFNTINVFSISLLAYKKILIFLSLFWVIIFNLSGLYKFQLNNKSRVDGIFVTSFAVLSAAFFTYLFIVFLHKEAFYSREIVILGAIIALLFLNITRYIIWQVYKKVYSK